MHSKKFLILIYLFLVTLFIAADPDLEGKRYFSMIPNSMYNPDCGTYVFAANSRFEYILYGGSGEGDKKGDVIFLSGKLTDAVEFRYNISDTNGSFGKEVFSEFKYILQSRDILLIYDSNKFGAWRVSTGEDWDLFEASISSTTTLIEDKKKPTQYSPTNLGDINNMKSFWSEGVAEYGLGETIRLDIDLDEMMGESSLVGVIIFNGVYKSEDLYRKNSRVKEFVVSANGEQTVIKLNDTRAAQLIYFSFKNNSSIKKVDFTIKSVYHGTKWKDTCVSKIILFGKNPSYR